MLSASLRTCCRSRTILQDGFWISRIGFRTAENEPSKVCYIGFTGCNDNDWIPCIQPRLASCEILLENLRKSVLFISESLRTGGNRRVDVISILYRPHSPRRASTIEFVRRRCGPLTFLTLREGYLMGAYRTKDGRFEECAEPLI